MIALHSAAQDPPVEAGRAHVRRGIAVIVSRFPKVTETFILREIDELERQGQAVLLVPLIRERNGIVHAEARPWMRRALFTPYLSREIIAGNLRMLRRQPTRSVRLLATLLARALADPAMVLRSLALWPKAVYLAGVLEREEIRHVHAHFATHPATVALIIHELTGISFSFTAHAHDIFVSRALLGRKIAQAAFVRVISTFNHDYLRARWPAECGEKLHVIHMGIDAPAYAKRARGRTVPSILCVAALKPYKGVEVLIDACAVLRDAGIDLRCDVIGEGPLRRALEERIRKLELTDRVSLIGALPQDRVVERLSRASLFVLPSVVARDGQMEGIPVALMEAMAAWLPVVASRLSGIPELVVHEETGLLVPPDDAHAIAAAVRRLLDEAWLARQLAARGARFVQWQFSLVNTTATLLDELDRHNPAPGDEVGRLIHGSTWRGFDERSVGVARIHARPDSSVLELVAAGSPSPQRVVLKCQRSRAGESYPGPARARTEYRVLQSLSAQPYDGLPTYGVPRPLHLDVETAAVLMEAVRGGSLENLLRDARASADPRRRAALLEAVHGAGVWLRRFQLQTRLDRPARPFLDELLRRIDHDLLRCSKLMLDRRAADALRASFDRLRWRLSPAELIVVGHHGDLWPGNIFASEDGIEVIDFEGFRYALPVEDAGYFLAHVGQYLRKPGRRDLAREARAAFLEGYQENTSISAGVQLAALAASLRLLVGRASRASSGIARAIDHIRVRALRRYVLQEEW